MTTSTLPASLANLTQPTRYLSVAETAKLIRKALKEAFPEVKFSVRSSSYSGGASIRVGWTDGPQKQQVERVAGAFQGASFDGMQDLKTSRQHTIDGQPIHFGADYVFCDREHSDKATANMIALVEAITTEERQQIAFRLGIHFHHPDYDLKQVREMAHAFLRAYPAPQFDGRRSPTAEAVTNITREDA